MNTPRRTFAAANRPHPRSAPSLPLGGSLLAAALLTLGLHQQAAAATYSWVTTTTTWDNTGAWSGGVAPTSDLDNVINFTTNLNSTATNNLGPFLLNRLAATNNSATNKYLTVTGTSGNALNFVRNSADALPTLAIANNAPNGPLTISIPFTVTDALTVTNSGAKAASISGAIANAAGITFDGTGAGVITLGNSSSGVTSGLGGITVNGSYTVKLTGNNTYTGDTTVSSGTLELGNNNRIANTSNLVMSGGTFHTAGFSETLGTLKLATADSTIDFGSGASALVFADSSGTAWDASFSLSITNFDTGVDSIRFGTTVDGLTIDQLGQITINGSAATIDSDGFLAIAIPEPSTYSAFLGLSALAAGALCRRKRA